MEFLVTVPRRVMSNWIPARPVSINATQTSHVIRRRIDASARAVVVSSMESVSLPGRKRLATRASSVIQIYRIRISPVHQERVAVPLLVHVPHRTPATRRVFASPTTDQRTPRVEVRQRAPAISLTAVMVMATAFSALPQTATLATMDHSAQSEIDVRAENALPLATATAGPIPAAMRGVIGANAWGAQSTATVSLPARPTLAMPVRCVTRTAAGRRSASIRMRAAATGKCATRRVNASPFRGSHSAFLVPLHRNAALASAACGFGISTVMGTVLAKRCCCAAQILLTTRSRLKLPAPSLPFLKTLMASDTRRWETTVVTRSMPAATGYSRGTPTRR